jgi:hypothetical protein
VSVGIVAGCFVSPSASMAASAHVRVGIGGGVAADLPTAGVWRPASARTAAERMAGSFDDR